MDELHDNLPPYNSDVERSLIATLLLYHGISEPYEELEVTDFYVPAHALVYGTMKHLHQEGKVVDIRVVAEILDRSGEIIRIGGKHGLMAMSTDPGGKWNIDGYVKIVRDLSIRRRLQNAAVTIGDMARHGAMEVEDILSISEKSILDVASQGSDKTKRFIQASLGTMATDVGNLWMNGDLIRGKSTGLHGLDKLISGLEDQKFYLLAARPGAGKTALALNIASHVSLTTEDPVLLYSLEMSEAEINQRLAQSLAKVSKERLESGRLTPDDWRRMADAAIDLDAAKLYIDDDASLTVDELFLRSRRAKAEHGKLGLIVVDYIQLMSGKGENRQLEISYISRKLKVISKDLDCPVLGLSQLSRNLESRTDKRPMLSDLRESGSLEQDANTVMFIYRDELYNPDTLYQGMPEIIVSKQRSGSTGMVRVGFVDSQTRFANLSREA